LISGISKKTKLYQNQNNLVKDYMKTGHVFLCAIGILAVAVRTDAQTLYGATSSGSGELYILNAADGSIVSDVGPLNDSGAVNYSVTGLAFDPLSGVLYGSTGGASGTDLLTINPLTGLVTVIGSFNVSGHSGATMTDLAFDQSGNLYGIGSSGGANLYSINLSTGQATEIGSGSGVSFTEGGGLAISSGDIFYAAPVPSDYGTYDSTTGAYTQIAAPATPAGGGSYAALAFDGSTLYGDNLVPGPTGGATHLVTIDPTTGNVTDLGASVIHLDAIAFQPVPEPTTMALLLGAGAMTLLPITRRKK
jgi:Repeat of unknown function (DUF6923)